MDLTKIDKPFGTLDIETKLALHRAHYEGKVIEAKTHIIDPDRWIVTNTPAWLPHCPYRVRPEPLRDISLPWAALDDRINYIARDEDGTIWGYEKEMCRRSKDWSSHVGHRACISGAVKLDPGNKPWDQSLIRRPGVAK